MKKDKLLASLSADIEANPVPFREATQQESRQLRHAFKLRVIQRQFPSSTVERFLDVLEAYGYDVVKRSS